MSKKTVIAGNPALDQTLPDVAITLAGKVYHLCFDYAALSIAERKLSDQGIKCNLLEALDLRSIGAERLPLVFFAALVKAQPSITYEQAKALVTMKTFGEIFTAVVDAFVASMAEPTAEKTPSDPTGPAAQ